jgi:hypothetical protein
LLLGSPLVLLGVVAWAAIDWAIYGVGVLPSRTEPIVPVFRFVNIGRDRDGGSQPNAIIWQTSTALEDCADVVDRRNRNEKQQIADLMISGANSPLNRRDENACAPFQLGKVEEGTKLEILGECGQMARVRILSGSLQGREGCIETGRLSETRHGAVPPKE